MKKIFLLLVVALLPVLGFGQSNLVRWSGSTSSVNLNPTIVAANGVSSSAISTGSSPSVSGEHYEGFTFNNWSNSTTLVSSQYIQFRITATAGYKIDLSQFIFRQKIDQGPRRYQVRYSKSTAFAGEESVLLSEVTSSNNWVTRTLNFPSGVTLNATETLYIRIYGYDPENIYWNGHRFTIGYQADGPVIRGTVSSATPPVPVAVNDAAATAFNTAATISVLGNDTYNGLATTVALVAGQGPANGTVSVNSSNQVVYTPATGFTGVNTFKYKISNANGTSNEATVTVNVAPRANNDAATVTQNVASTITVLGNDTYNGTPTVAITQAPANGTASVNASGQIVYTSTAAFTGTNTIRYTVTTANGTSNEATVTLTVVPPAPVAVNDSAATLQNQAVTINVLGNDTVNGLATTINLTAGSNGTVALSSNQVVFTPANNFLGNATFTYTLTNANGTSGSATVTVNITAPIAPTAVVDSFPVAFNAFTDLNVLANDNLGSATSVTAINTTNPAHGTVSVNANNTIRYTPVTGYAGADSFTYRIQTVYGTSSYVTVSVMVQPTTPTGALCGDIYVGAYGHFATITQAINHVNTYGITCNVTMFLTNANYNNATGETFPITINAYTGSNTYNLTIKPNSGVNATVQASNINGWTPVRSVFKLDGARRVTFDGSNNSTASKNLTLVNNCTIYDGSSRTVLALTGSYSRVTFKNLQITQANENGAYAYACGIYSGGDDIANKQAGNVSSDNLIASNNDFSGVKQGIYIDNNNNATLTTVSIFGNRFGQNVGSIKAQNAIHLGGVANFTIYQNQVKDINSNFNADHYRAIYVNGNNGTIYKNTVYNIKRTGNDQSISGIWLKSNVNSNPVNVVVSNNFITDVQTPGANNSNSQGAYGIYIETGNGYKIYHNSINLKQQSQTTGISAAFFVVSGSNLDVRNNIFNNNLEYDNGNAVGRASIGVINYTNSTFAHLDYNNYYSKGVVGIKGSGDINWVNAANNTVFIQTLAQWRTSTGNDANTANVLPVFVNENNDLHLVAGNITNVQYLGGVTGLGILDDIDGEERYVPRPTMGADEIDETHCAGTITWNGTSWSTYVLNGVTNPAPSASWTGNPTLRVVIAGPYTMGNANLLQSCQLEIIANPAAKLIIGENATYIVEDKLTLNDGSIMVIQDKGSFVQVSEPDKNSIHPNATFEVHRKTQPMYRYDFTYWSSPVEGFKLKQVSPLTLFDKFYSWNPGAPGVAGSWTTLPQPANSTTMMEVGKGYIVRAPQNFSTNPTVRVEHESVFVGKPNNGVRQVTIANGSADKWNLIGNPYPSAIDAAAFLDANPNLFENGAIYTWTHNSALVPTTTGSQIYTYSASDYATWNKSGATRAGSGGSVPNGKIASGQSFFIKGKVSNPAGTQVRFNNSMRVKAANQNGQFFRPGSSEPVDNWETTGKHRIWLNLTGGQNAFNQAMVGYIESATNELDWGYDADVFSGGAVSLYSLVNNKNLTIQGRALPFSNQDEVPLGYKTTLTGTLKISIDEVDGLFAGQDVYLEDKVLNVVHNLKESEYAFTTVPGTFNERFVLRYVPAAELGIDTPAVDANSIVVFRNDRQINIKSNDQSIAHVTVYDLLGKVIFEKNKINAQSFSIAQLNVSNQMVIVKVITDTQAEVVKKVILN